MKRKLNESFKKHRSQNTSFIQHKKYELGQDYFFPYVRHGTGRSQYTISRHNSRPATKVFRKNGTAGEEELEGLRTGQAR